MASIPNNDAWREFFECLESLPELWKVKDDIFKSREEKIKAWEKLLENYRNIDSNGTLEEVKKRVLNIKSCYRRELKKVENSKKSGCSSDDIHIPSLWYFNNLEFLRDQEKQSPGLSSMDVSDENELMETGTEAVELPSPMPRKKKRSVGQHMAERNELLRSAIRNISQNSKGDVSESEAEIYAKSWATSFQKLSPAQQIYCKKAIEEILVLGQLELLTLHTVSSPSSSSSRTSTPLLGISPPSSSDSHSHLVQSSQQEAIPILTVNTEQPSATYNSFKDLLTDFNFS